MSIDDRVPVRALRIAVVANTSWYLYNFRLNLMRALAGDGHFLVAVGSDDDYAKRLRDEGIAQRAVTFSGSGTNPWRELRTLLALRRVFAKERIDVVFSYTPKGNIYSALALLGRPGSLAMNISGLGAAFARNDRLAMLVRGLYRISLHRAAWVFFQNEEDRSLFLERRLIDASRSSRLPGSGVDLTMFDPGLAHGAAAERGGPLFIMVARMLWDKGVGEFVEAARQVKLQHPSARFRMLGSLAADHRGGVPEATLRGWVDEGVVEYAGSVHNVRPQLEEADCVVLPSVYREGVPRSLLEAAAMARPVITTDSVGCRDTVDHEVTGFLCRPRDATDVARQMLRLLAMTPEARRCMGEAGRRKMEREFSESRVIEAYRQHIQEIAGHPMREA
jgi:glycosyltransferase involved in cell wall biosynthesis